MLRKLGLSVAIASALVVGKVNALGMGEISVKSALNEPLYAEIKLLQVKNLSPLQIKSRMADLNDFALSGLATQRALSDVRFQIRVNPNGTGRIILTSKLPVTEPFMNFLVEVNWPSGRLIREYTLLLDPPSYANNIQNSRNFNKPTEVVAPTRAPAAVRPKPRAPAPSTASTAKPGQYYIRNKDTLWDIAVANRPDSSITSQQMMVLIQRKNPQAFPSENINVMEANVLIDLPTKAELDALTPKQANDEVQRQTRLWRNGLVPKVVAKKPAAEKPAVEKAAAEQPAAESMMKKPEDTAAKPDEMKKPDVDDQSMEMKANEEMMAAEAAKLKEKEKGMLNVVSPEDLKAKQEMAAKAEAMSLSASKDADKIAQLQKENAELDTKLALSEESIDRLSREGEELSNKLDTIAKQLDDMNRLIMLKDEQLAAFQEERVLEDQARAEKEKAESNKSWLDKLLEDPVGLAAGISGWLLAIVAGVLLLLRRRKKDETEELGDEKSEPSISLPDEMIEDELDELEILDDPAQEKEVDESSDAADDLADLGEVEDLDLDLDLDMDLDLDETLDEEVLDTASGALDMDDEGDDLAAQLEAELNTGTDDIEDDDLDVLEGIDSLEFDLGETEELDEDANSEALAELASVMDDDDIESTDIDSTDIESADIESADLDEPEDSGLVEDDAQALDSELAEDLDIADVEDEPVDEDEILEAAADLGNDLSLESDDEEVEAAIASPEEGDPAIEDEQLSESISETTVEDIELDIDDIEGITTLDDMEANEAQQSEAEQPSEDNADDLSELALDEDELDISDLSLEDELSEDDILEAVNNPSDAEVADSDVLDEELALDEAAEESVDALTDELEQDLSLTANDEPDLTELNADELEVADLDADELAADSLEANDLDELDLEDVDLDALDLDDVDLSGLDMEDSLEAANLENPVVEDAAEDDGDLDEALETLASEDSIADLDDGLLELDESEALDSVDESLDELLAQSGDSVSAEEESSALDTETAENVETGAEDALALEEELDELLNSTDDEIALNEIQPEMDTDMEEAIDLLDGEDGVQMKLDLARAYMEMGDEEGAADIVAEIMADGDEAQKQEAQALLQLNS